MEVRQLKSSLGNHKGNIAFSPSLAPLAVRILLKFDPVKPNRKKSLGSAPQQKVALFA
jgi:hypothetical protein